MKLKKCLLLLPTAYNDGTEIPPNVLVGILNGLYDAFGGYTVDGTCDGVYKMSDGSKARDKSLKIWVAADTNKLDELREVAQGIAGTLKQESLWFEVTDAEVEFLEPPEGAGEGL